ncbi:MAG: tail fiber protein [Rhodanobacter sp.]
MSDYFIGQIMLTGFNFAPRNFALCNGQLMPIAQNQALFALLGVQYGGDGVRTFALPDLRGRVPLNSGAATGANYSAGDAGGVPSVTLNNANLPIHNHGMLGTSTAGAAKTPTGALYGNTSGTEALYAPSSGAQVVLAQQNLGAVGGNQPHNNMQPYEVVSFAIALTGIFPSRG